MLSLDSDFQSGISFLDKLYPKGVNRPGVYGIIAPTGVGKSVLSGMIVLDTILHRYSYGKDVSDVRPWVHFDLHNGDGLYKERMAGRAKEWRQAILENMNVMRKSAVFREYVHTEAEFYADFTRFLGPQIFSYTDVFGKTMTEIFADLALCSYTLKQETLESRHLGGIIIDGAPNVWYAILPTVSYSEYDFLKVHLPRFLRVLSCLYKCPVWVTHQVTGEACDKDAIDLLHHRDARSCKDFAESFDACFVLGNHNPDPENSVFTIRCTHGVSFAEQKKMCLLKFRDGGHSIEEVEAQVADAKTRMWKPKSSPKALMADDDQLLLDNEIRELELELREEDARHARASDNEPADVGEGSRLSVD